MRYSTLAGVTFALCTPLLGVVVHAGPHDSVESPIVVDGEKEIGLNWGIQKNRDGTSATAFSVGFGVGVTPWWSSEISVKYKRPAGDVVALDAWEWGNHFQLSETGKYPVDIGFLLEIERPEDRTEGYEITFGPMFQAEWDRVQGNLNLLFQKHVQASVPFDTELHYQLQLKYRQSEKLEWGAQAFGSLGQWDNWAPSAKQEHKFGPAIFGKIKTGVKQAVLWNAALLRGTTSATAPTTLRLQAEYEF